MQVEKRQQPRRFMRSKSIYVEYFVRVCNEQKRCTVACQDAVRLVKLVHNMSKYVSNNSLMHTLTMYAYMRT